MEGQGEGVGGDREAMFRKQAEVRTLLPAALMAGVQGGQVIPSGQLESVRHDGQGKTAVDWKIQPF